jgi:nucleotide-binding universal stress UspA family protein
MKQTWLVGYDGSESSKRAVDYAAQAAKIDGHRIVLAHVLEWSPYSFLTPQELAERHKRRKEELERARKIVQPAVEQLKKDGIDASCEVRYGHAGDMLCEIATDAGASQIVVGRTGGSALANRLLGSLAVTLVQAAPVPVTIVP